MAKLLGLLLLVAALAGAAALVPVGGRTVLDRWNAARSPGEFASRAWTEVAVASGLQDPPPRRPAARATRPERTARRPVPVEHHTDADRAALERIVSEHAEK